MTVFFPPVACRFRYVQALEVGMLGKSDAGDCKSFPLKTCCHAQDSFKTGFTVSEFFSIGLIL